MKTYKGFCIKKGENPITGKFYFIIKDNEQLAPNDFVCPTSLREVKKFINNYKK